MTAPGTSGPGGGSRRATPQPLSVGARVVLAARRADRLDALASELPGSLAVATDVTRREHLERLVARALDTCGRIDVLVNNAGQGLHVPIEELDPADLRAVFELNVIAPLVGEAIAFAISTGEAHVLVGSPPRPSIPGDDKGWSALLARQAPGT